MTSPAMQALASELKRLSAKAGGFLREATVHSDGIASIDNFERAAQIVYKMVDSLTYGKTSRPDKLPAAVVIRLVEHLEMRDRLALARSCRRMRKILLDCHELWVMFGDIKGRLDIPPLLRYKSALLERSYPAPTPLELNALICEGAPYATLLKRNFSRLTSLDMSCRGPWVLDKLSAQGLLALGLNFGEEALITRPSRLEAYDEWHPIHEVLRTPAPLLEELDIFIHNTADWRAEAYLASDVLACEPGRLRRCSLTSVWMPYDYCHTFSQLTNFCYEPHDRTIDRAELDRILVEMPCLETLCLTVGVYYLQDGSPKPEAHPNLRNVALRAITHGSVELVEYFKEHNIVQLILDQMRVVTPEEIQGPGAQQFQTWAHEAGREIPELFPDSNRLYLGLYQACLESDDPAHPRQVRFSASNALGSDFFHSPDTFANLTSLTIHEGAWDRGVPFHSAPQLTQLTVCLASCFDFWAAAMGSWVAPVSGILQMEPELLQWHVPRLRRLAIVALPQYRSRCRAVPPYLRGRVRDCKCAQACCVSLADLYHCLRSALKFDAERLECLTFGGIQHFVDPDMAASLRALEEWAEEVEFVEEDPDLVPVENLVWQSPINPAYAPMLYELFMPRTETTENRHIFL